MKGSTVTVTYEPTDGERFAVSVSVPGSYPDHVDEARAAAVKAMHELVADALAQYGAHGDG